MNNQLSDTFTYSPPVAPDTSKGAYDAASGPRIENNNYKFGWSPLGTTLGWWFNARKNRNYEQWKLKAENEYNRALAEWQTYMSSPSGQKTAFEDAGFNANYTDPSNMSAASPGSYQHVEGDPVKDNVSNLISTMLSLVSGFQGLQSNALDIEHKQIENKYLDQFIQTRNSNLYEKGILQGLQADNAQLQFTKLLGSLFTSEDTDTVLRRLQEGTLFYPDYNTDGWSLGAALSRGPFAAGLDLNNEHIDKLIESLGLKNLIDQPIADMAGANAGLKIFGTVGMGLIRLLLAFFLKK